MKVCLIKRVSNNTYYLKKGRWSKQIFCESFFTEQAAKWHRTYVLNRFKLLPEEVVVEEYNMVSLPK